MAHIFEDEKTVLSAKLGQLLWISEQSCPDIWCDRSVWEIQHKYSGKFEEIE